MRIGTILLSCLAVALIAMSAAFVPQYVLAVQVGVSHSPSLEKASDEIKRLTADIPHFVKVEEVQSLNTTIVNKSASFNERFGGYTLPTIEVHEYLLEDGTPVSEAEFHKQEEMTSSKLAGK